MNGLVFNAKAFLRSPSNGLSARVVGELLPTGLLHERRLDVYRSNVRRWLFTASTMLPREGWTSEQACVFRPQSGLNQPNHAPRA
jgi:hypothetical protein